jgi:hypothetical protein
MDFSGRQNPLRFKMCCRAKTLRKYTPFPQPESALKLFYDSWKVKPPLEEMMKNIEEA